MSEPKELPDDANELKQQLEQALAEIASLKEQKERQDAQPANQGRSSEPTVDVTPINEADVTLRRLVQRIAMILQAEKIVIMFFDREKGDLIGIPPAYGVDDEHLRVFKVRATQGVSGEVFRSGEPIIFHDPTHDERTKADPFGLLGVNNGITVPLVIEKRDEENRVIERNTIGVLHAFNKRHGEDFNDEDVRLLERMAKNVGSIISNLQLYREVVEEREELLQTFESLTAGLVLVSPEGRISQINASARAVFTVGQDAIGKNYGDIFRQEGVRQFFNDQLSGADTKIKEITIVIAGSERLYECQGAAVKSEEGKDLGVVAIFNDVTEVRNIDKMKSSFVAMASHELRTPLTAIKGFVRTLLDGEDYFTAQDRHEFHTIIDHECDRLRRLIDDLLNTARIESGQSLKPDYTEFELMPVLEKCVVIQQQASNKHTVKLEVENELPKTILGDQDKLDQILTNLLNNAIKYSPGGGQVTVMAKNEGETLLIGIKDEGLGIPKEHITKVFEKFHRVNNDDNRRIYGTGLGLYLVHHLVTMVHMGEIWAESEVGVGSTFWFRIPSRLDVDKARKLND